MKKYIVTKYMCIGGTYYNSEPMDYEDALEVYNAMTKNARRGLCAFPDLLDENGNIVM